jgi:hypothetical protein
MTQERAKQLLKLVKWESSGCLHMDSIKPDYPEETPEETRFIKDYAEKNNCFRLFDAYLKLSKGN